MKKRLVFFIETKEIPLVFGRDILSNGAVILLDKVPKIGVSVDQTGTC
jgi:hypothetical protein